MKRGCLQVYTGDGKGKTTAALGLGLRAVGNGLKVIMFQFLKGMHSGEIDSASFLDGRFEIVRLAKTKKFISSMNEKEKAELKRQLQEEMSLVYEVLASNSCDILILDEIMAAIHGGFLTTAEVCALIDSRPAKMELILTGRAAPREIVAKADLVTEMRCIKHYIDRGVQARKGIES